MKKEELRIGNLVNYEQTNHIIKELHGDKVLHLWVGSNSDGYYTSYDLISPINITEDILLMLGFTTITENSAGVKNYWNKEKDCSIDVFVHVIENGIELQYEYRLHERQRLKQLIYVHELQNLYYSLRGEEITNNNFSIEHNTNKKD